ncbi:MAG: hypothetical protein ACREFY_09000 [Acetobacteraceae bacterium]
MRTLLALIVLAPIAAHAATRGSGISNAAREAKSYLTPCHQKVAAAQGLCEINQGDFVEEYVRALAGDVYAQGSTAASFDPMEGLADRLGLPKDAIQACAWFLVQASGPKTNAGYAAVARSACERLPDDALLAGRLRATALLRRISTSPVGLPADWDPTCQEIHLMPRRTC